jgi:hypothetical protein
MLWSFVFRLFVPQMPHPLTQHQGFGGRLPGSESSPTRIAASSRLQLGESSRQTSDLARRRSGADGNHETAEPDSQR